MFLTVQTTLDAVTLQHGSWLTILTLQNLILLLNLMYDSVNLDLGLIQRGYIVQ